MSPLRIALQFLTCLPVGLQSRPSGRHVGWSLVFYPLVGLIIGLPLSAFGWLMHGTPALTAAALLLATWVVLTGGLHLDGLADSADAWVGGLGNREKTLAIMKDPLCGPAGVVTLILVLLLKFSALHAVTVSGDWTAPLLATTLGRTALPLLFLTTPYVRRIGLGVELSDNIPRRPVSMSVAATVVAIAIVGGMHNMLLLVAAMLVFLILRSMMIRRIGGITGDTAGAMVEITETAIMLTAVVL